MKSKPVSPMQLKSTPHSSPSFVKRTGRIARGLVLIGLVSAGTASGAQVLFYDFDSPGATQTSSGSDSLVMTSYVSNVPTNLVVSTPLGPDGQEGVLGQAGATEATLLQSPNLTGNVNFTTGLGSFTFTSWVQNVTTGPSQRIFSLRGGSAAAIDLLASGAAGTDVGLALGVNGTIFAGSTGGGTGTVLRVPNQSMTWTFVGVTFDSATGQAVFYSGSLGGSLASFTPSGLSTATQVTDSTTLNIGNIPGGGALFNGNIDDVGFYNTVLTPGEMELMFTSVPEPGSVMLLGFAGLLFTVVMGRRSYLNKRSA